MVVLSVLRIGVEPVKNVLVTSSLTVDVVEMKDDAVDSSSNDVVSVVIGIVVSLPWLSMPIMEAVSVLRYEGSPSKLAIELAAAKPDDTMVATGMVFAET